jgi:hypothetical protein
MAAGWCEVKLDSASVAVTGALCPTSAFLPPIA